jgi:hypothetical protein
MRFFESEMTDALADFEMGHPGFNDSPGLCASHLVSERAATTPTQLTCALRSEMIFVIWNLRIRIIWQMSCTQSCAGLGDSNTQFARQISDLMDGNKVYRRWPQRVSIAQSPQGAR